MLKSQTAELLAIAAAVDNRKPTPAMLSAWHDVVGDVEYEDARAALVSHRKNSPGVYLEPGHIVKEIRQALYRHQEIYGIHPAPPEGKQWAADVIDSSPRFEVEE